MPIDPPDLHHLNAATGWLMLGNIGEARCEFDRIQPALRVHPEVLTCEWQLLAREQRWAEAAAVGGQMVAVCPGDAGAWVNRSFALHELRRTREALEQLLPAVTRFPRDAIIRYNLACYTCQLGDLAAARRWFEQSLALGKPAREQRERLRSALEDADLKPLWPEIQQRLAKLSAAADE